MDKIYSIFILLIQGFAQHRRASLGFLDMTRNTFWILLKVLERYFWLSQKLEVLFHTFTSFLRSREAMQFRISSWPNMFPVRSSKSRSPPAWASSYAESLLVMTKGLLMTPLLMDLIICGFQYLLGGGGGLGIAPLEIPGQLFSSQRISPFPVLVFSQMA